MSLPAPYYQDDSATIYHGDCREILPLLPRVDLVLTDPPYGMGIDPRRFDNVAPQRRGMVRTQYADDCDWDSAPFDARPLIDAIPKNAEVFLWGADYYRRSLPEGGSWLVWDKKLPSMSELPGSDFELCWCRPKRKRQVFRITWSGYLAKEPTERRAHPTQKPLALMRRCLSLAPSAKTVIDPYLGSGTTLRAAKDLGRQSIGIEIEERYCEIAAKRLAQETLGFQGAP